MKFRAPRAIAFWLWVVFVSAVVFGATRKAFLCSRALAEAAHHRRWVAQREDELIMVRDLVRSQEQRLGALGGDWWAEGEILEAWRGHQRSLERSLREHRVQERIWRGKARVW